MTGDYAEYEAECTRIRTENEDLLAKFAAWLREQKLKESTIKGHVTNIDFYVNDFLLYEDAIEPADGIGDIGYFLGDWFIRKAMWSNQAQIKSNAASLKKFYTFMNEQGLVSDEDLDAMKAEIKEEMPEWLATMERYDDPNIDDMDEVWGF